MTTVKTLSSLLPQPTNTPKLYLLIRSIKPDLEDAWIRVSRDLPSAHAFAQAYTLNKYIFLYTELEVNGVTELPFPDVVYLAIGQKTSTEIRDLGLGFFKTVEEAKLGLDEMASDPSRGFTRFQVSECRVQLGLTQEDDELLDKLNEAAFEAQMKSATKTAP